MSARVQVRDRQIILSAEVLIPRSAAEVRAILVDFENLPRVNEDLREVRVLERWADGRVRMRVLARLCILSICLEFAWIQEIQLQPTGDILAIIDTGQSDFREGWARWRLLPHAGGTNLVFNACLRPKFWFPPLIASWLIKHKLNQEALAIGLGVERVAAHR